MSLEKAGLVCGKIVSHVLPMIYCKLTASGYEAGIVTSNPERADETLEHVKTGLVSVARRNAAGAI